MSNLDPTTAVWTIVNVTLIPVPLPPVFNASAIAAGYTIAEGAYGWLSPPIVAADPQLLPLSYAIPFSTSLGGVTIGATNGSLYVPPPGLSYLAVLAQVCFCVGGPANNNLHPKYL